MSKISDVVLEKLLINVVELTNDIICVFDKYDVIYYCNEPFSDILTLDIKQIIGKTFTDIITASYENNTGLNIDTDTLDDWLEMASERRRSKPFRSFEVDTVEGRWFRFTELIIDDYLFLYGTNITASKLIELKLTETQDKLQRLASTDFLTGIYNRRQFNKLASQELLRCERNELHATLVLLDIDYFKKINDKYGHACGDAVLVHLSDRIKAELRSYDIFARIGGEEFAVLLPEVDNSMAKDIANRYLKRISDTPFYYEGEYIDVTVSIGLSESYPDIKTLDYILKCADEHLYKAKAAGRNQVASP